ncbi:MAG: alpha/beta fold hydrolase [Planctomycetota bacterium]
MIKRKPLRRFFRRLGYYCIATIFFVPSLFFRKMTNVPEPVDFTENINAFTAKFGDVVEKVDFVEPTTNEPLHGWFLPADKAKAHPSKPCVLLCHGLGGNISQMLPRVNSLHENGCDVLAFDFRGHGESGGVFASLGYFEMRDVIAAIDYLRDERGIQRVALYGFSMGAVAALLAAAHDGRVAAVVAESPYDSMQSVVTWKAKELYHAPAFVVRVALWTTGVRRGIEYKEVDLVKALPKLAGVPLLLAGTASDVTIPIEMTRRLAAVLSDGQEYWEVNGPDHGEICSSEYGPEFERRILALLKRCEDTQGIQAD